MNSALISQFGIPLLALVLTSIYTNNASAEDSAPRQPDLNQDEYLRELLQRTEVVDEIKLTQQQKDKLRGIEDEFNKDLQAFRDLSRELLTKHNWKKIREITKAKIKANEERYRRIEDLLSDQQFARLIQLKYQGIGPQAAFTTELRESLEITNEQFSRYVDLRQYQENEFTKRYRKLPGGLNAREEALAMREIYFELRDHGDREIRKRILTSDQFGRLKAEFGNPVSFQLDFFDPARFRQRLRVISDKIARYVLESAELLDLIRIRKVRELIDVTTPEFHEIKGIVAEWDQKETDFLGSLDEDLNPAEKQQAVFQWVQATWADRKPFLHRLRQCLGDERFKRLNEIQLQVVGPWVINRPDLKVAFGVTAKQEKERRLAFYDEFAAQGRSPKKAISDAYHLQMLTPKQQRLWKDRIGKPVDEQLLQDLFVTVQFRLTMAPMGEKAGLYDLELYEY